jgi:two-component system LytT family response regulator
LKPFDDDRLASAIARARERLGSFDSSRLVECLNSLIKQAAPSNGSSTAWLKRLAVHGRLGYEMVPIETIDWISAADNYVELHCGESTHLLTETMSSLEQRLNPVEFARVHRGRIVNVSRITAIAPTLNGSYELRLRSGTRLSTGRQYKNVILKIIGKTEAS